MGPPPLGRSAEPAGSLGIPNVSAFSTSVWRVATLHRSEGHLVGLALQVQHHHEESHEESSNAGFEPLKDIYALGDCCANVEGPLPSLAQVCTTAVVQSLSLDLWNACF